MINQNSFTPFHHYDFNTIDNTAVILKTELIKSGSDAIGEYFLTLKEEKSDLSFSFMSVGKNDDGIIYMCVFNNQPFVANQYHIIRAENNDFFVRVNHQYSHYGPNKEFIGKLPYHLYQLAKNTLDNEKIITAYSTLDALHTFESNASAS